PWLERVLRRTPQDHDANQAMATALRRLNRDAEAETYEPRKNEVERDLHRMDELIKASLSNPRDAARRYQAGTILLRPGQEPQTVGWLVSALVLDPGHQATKRALADCIRRLGDPQLEAAYHSILEERPPRK